MAGTHTNLEEPKTPGWLPVVGILLFLGVGLAWALCPADKEAASPTPAPTASAAPARGH